MKLISNFVHIKILGSQRRDLFFSLLLGLFVVRLILNAYGFDVVPFLSNADEVIIQDQSYYLHQHGVFKAMSFYGQLIDKTGSHHPPLFLWIQSGLFDLFGFNPSSLRLPSIIYSAASIAVLLYCIFTISAAGLAGKAFARLVAIIALIDPTYITWSRFGRHDTLANLLFCISLAFLMKSYLWSIRAATSCRTLAGSELINTVNDTNLPAKALWSLLASSILIGLSLSTHLQAVYGYLFYISFLFLIGRTYLPLSLILLCVATPVVVFCSLWACAYNENIAYSVEVFNVIQRQFAGSQNWPSVLSLIFNSSGSFNAQKFSHLGGSMLIYHGFAYFLAIVALCTFLLSNIQHTCFADSKKLNMYSFSTGNVISLSTDAWAILGIFAFALQLFLIYFKYGVGASRFYCFYPSTILMTPIILEWITTKCPNLVFRRFTLISLTLLIVINIGLLASYTKVVHSRIYTNKYAQVEDVVGSLTGSVEHGVALPPVFWLAAHVKLPGKNIQVIENGFVMWGALDTEAKVDLLNKQKLDIIILPEKSSLVTSLEESNGGFRIVDAKSILGSKYLVLRRSL